MKYLSYLVLSPNILNKSVLEFDKYVRNVVDDVVSSQGVVAINAFSMLWSGMGTIL